MNAARPPRRCHPRRIGPGHPRRQGFTLLEILIATAACAILLVALNSILFSAMRLRNEAVRRGDEVLARQRARAIIERDLRNGIVSGGVIADRLSSEPLSEGLGRADHLEITTTTGVIDAGAPWGDVQRVEYFLGEVATRTNSVGRALVRATRRNLLAAVEEEPALTPLLRGVRSFEVTFYDEGMGVWRDSWTYESEIGSLPAAIRVYVEFEPDERKAWRSFPLELVVPWVVQPAFATEETDEESASDEGDQQPGGQGGTPGDAPFPGGNR